MALDIKFEDVVDVVDYAGKKYRVKVKMLSVKERNELLRNASKDLKVNGIGDINFELDPMKFEEFLIRFAVKEVIDLENGNVVENKIDFVMNLPVVEYQKIFDKILEVNPFLAGQ